MGTTATAHRCAHVRANGSQCGLNALAGGRFCWWHDPAKAADRAAARSKGGKARHGRAIRYIPGDDSGPVMVQTAADLLQIVEDEINLVRALEAGHRRARTVGYLVGIAIRAIELSELENRIAALEERMGEYDGKAA